MQSKATDLITEKLSDWTPSPEAQALITWRVLHLLMARYGSVPLGQLLVGMTSTVLNELGHSPTVTDLCEATGLPKSSISRYISAQMAQGTVQETIDPQDRRRRMLTLTDEGRNERKWQTRQFRRILEEVRAWDEEVAETGKLDPEAELELMKKIVQEGPEAYHSRPKRGRRLAA